MKKNYLALFALLTGFCACDDEQMIKSNPEFLATDEAALRITMTQGGGTSTRAVGDKIEVGTLEEKDIRSVAFIVKTEAETKDGTPMPGVMNYYLSSEEILSANGLSEELVVDNNVPGDSTYTCQIKVKSKGWGTPKVLVVANYLENGVDIAAIMATANGNWNTLPDLLLSQPLEANPTTPLLMFGMIDNVSEWTTNGGGTAGRTIKMTRLVSRIDIRNNAYNGITPADGFELVSARFIYPKQHSHILSTISADKVDAIPVVASFPTHANIETDAANNLQRLDTLYTYENLNGSGAGNTPTRLEVNGFFRGSKTSRIIDFKRRGATPGSADITIPLTRNTRYVVNINPTKDSLNVDWSITVKEWTESDTIRIRPSFPKPEITDLAFEGGAAPGLILGADGKSATITSPYAGGSFLTFTTSAPQATTYTVKYMNNNPEKNSLSIGWEDGKYKAAIEQGDPVIHTKAVGTAKVTRTYRIAIPHQELAKQRPMDAYVIILNGGDAQVRDTVTLKYRYYEGIVGAMPVLMKDGRFWAPVNVGQTVMATSITKETATEANCGKLFQWGRKLGFSPVGTVPLTTTLVGTADHQNGAFESVATWKDKFITVAAAPYDWMAVKNDKLWNIGSESMPQKNRFTDPCPEGWRVPTLAEWKNIGADDVSVVKTFANGFMTFTATGFTLPAAGGRSGSSGSSSNQGSSGDYWSSSVPSGSAHASNVYFGSATLATHTGNRANGFSVRCVQE